MRSVGVPGGLVGAPGGFIRVSGKSSEVRQKHMFAPARRPGGIAVDSPRNLDLKKDSGLTVEWSDGTRSFYPIAYLRRMSPSAEARQIREELARNPLTVLPAGKGSGPLTAVDAELVGN